MGRAVSYREKIIMTRNVAVPRQVIWILVVLSTTTTGFLDHTDGGL